MAGLRVDRTPTVVIIGGAIETTGTPIQIGGKSEASRYIIGVTILGIDLENANNVAEAYLEVGYGWSGAPGGAVLGLTVTGCTFFTGSANTAIKGIECRDTNGA